MHVSDFLQPNIGTADRIARLLLGVVLLSLTVVGPQSLWGLIGVIPLLTGLVRMCPLYALIGLKTCPKGQC